MPSQVAGENPDGQQVFTVNGKNKLTAYSADGDGKFQTISDYWTQYGQQLIDTIGTYKKSELAFWIVGDSTVSEFNDQYYYPRYGWGTQISNYLKDGCEVHNLALSGRSSKSLYS